MPKATFVERTTPAGITRLDKGTINPLPPRKGVN
jgi:hypothetical protein